jgi:hypothetical protein
MAEPSSESISFSWSQMYATLMKTTVPILCEKWFKKTKSNKNDLD